MKASRFWGELAAVRKDDGIGKAYAFLVGVSGGDVYFAGPYKDFDNHHFDMTKPIPLDSLFGNVPKFGNQEESSSGAF